MFNNGELHNLMLIILFVSHKLLEQKPTCPFLCLPVSRLFWVSSLAYPNLLGTKGYVVVVVVVVVEVMPLCGFVFCIRI
jgi:hypothetical protein